MVGRATRSAHLSPGDIDVRVVAALGGNALARRGEEISTEVQRRNLQSAAAALVPLARANELVLTFGNGPQDVPRQTNRVAPREAHWTDAMRYL